MRAPALELRHVKKRFGSARAPIWALSDVSIILYEGETLGIVGESGSGKSTIARLCVGLEEATEGEVRVFGQLIESRARSGSVQMVFQDPGSSLDPLLRISRSVREPLDADPDRVYSARSSRATEALKEVGLRGDFADRFPTALSGGQKQRASIARALAALPPVLICDEAVTALDVSVRAQILNLLRLVQSQHQTSCLFISHDLCTVAYMSDRVVVMYLGKIVEMAPTARLFASAGHPYTCALLSAVPKLQQGARLRPRIRLTGDPPSAMSPPKGCRFHTRCPIAAEQCRVDEPPLREIGAGHEVACHFAPAEERVIASLASGSMA